MRKQRSGIDPAGATGASNAVAGRVALFTRDLSGGGAQRVMTCLANDFTALGVHVDLVVVKAAGPFMDSLDPSVRVVPLGCRRMRGSVLPLTRYLRKERPDAILAALPQANIAVVVAAALARVPIQVVCSEHSVPSFASRNGTRGARLSYRLARLLYRRADVVVAVSEGVRLDLLNDPRLSPGKVRTICNPIVPEALLSGIGDRASPEGRAGSDGSYGWDDLDDSDGSTGSHGSGGDADAPIILAAGRLIPQKGFDTLLRSFALIREERDVRLWLAGEGPARASLTALAHELGVEEDVHLLGFVPDLHARMRAARIFVLPSHSESFGNVLVEAMACGAAVVATDCPVGPREILENGRHGALVPVGDVRAMADAVMRALDDPGSARERRERAGDFGIRRASLLYLEAMIGLPETVPAAPASMSR